MLSVPFSSNFDLLCFIPYYDLSSNFQTTCGTPEYVSPEMLDQSGHDIGADYWALGILIYECLAGKTPFASDYYTDTYDMILSYAKHNYDFQNDLTTLDVKVESQILQR